MIAVALFLMITYAVISGFKDVFDGSNTKVLSGFMATFFTIAYCVIMPLTMIMCIVVGIAAGHNSAFEIENYNIQSSIFVSHNAISCVAENTMYQYETNQCKVIIDDSYETPLLVAEMPYHDINWIVFPPKVFEMFFDGPYEYQRTYTIIVPSADYITYLEN
jgi:hypothetical protein